jgi:transcriptional regulator NrdR family protein
MRCPKCFKKAETVKAYSTDSKQFTKIFNWKHCPHCKGYILAKDCKRGN